MIRWLRSTTHNSKETGIRDGQTRPRIPWHGKRARGTARRSVPLNYAFSPSGMSEHSARLAMNFGISSHRLRPSRWRTRSNVGTRDDSFGSRTSPLALTPSFERLHAGLHPFSPTSMLKNAVVPRHGFPISRCSSPGWSRRSLRSSALPSLNAPFVMRTLPMTFPDVGPFATLRGVNILALHEACLLVHLPDEPREFHESPSTCPRPLHESSPSKCS